MKTFRSACFSFGFAVLGLLAPARPATSQATQTAATTAQPSTAQQLDDYVRQYERAGLFSGSVLVADHSGVLLQKGYAQANRATNTPNTPATHFRIGSLTKQFTAALVLRLVEKGQLRLDGRVIDYLPNYPSAAGGQITLHQLMTHTAGLPDYTDQPGFAALVGQAQTPAQLVALFAALPLDFAPGTQYHYSNSNYILLGAIVEQVTGRPYAQVFARLIARPAKLRDTAYEPTEPASARRAAGYQPTPNGLVPTPFIHMSVPYAAGSITSTVADLYRWNQALAAGKVLSVASQRVLFAPVKNNYACGWMVYRARIGSAPDTVTVQEHNGAVNGFASFLVRVPARQQCIVLLDNHSSKALADLRRGLLRILNHQPALPPVVAAAPGVLPAATAAAAAPVAVDAAVLATYSGVYELSPAFRITVRARAGQLFVQATGQSEFETQAASPVLFALKGVPAQVEFTKNSQGKVAQLILHQGGQQQVAAKVE